VSHQPPSDLVELGQVFDAQGLKGHIKVRPYSQDPIALLHCKQIYVQRDGTRYLDEISEFGAHPVMTVGKELIPFVPALVRSVDLQASDPGGIGTIVVAWQPNWSE